MCPTASDEAGLPRQKPEDVGRGLLLRVLARDNLQRAWKRVKSNRGAAGVDGLDIAQTGSYLKHAWPIIRQQLTMSARNANSIALTPQWARWIDDLVANGEYQSASEVVRDGLRALHDDRERREAELGEIRARLQRALMEADAGTLAEGSGEAAVKRAFDRASAAMSA